MAGLAAGKSLSLAGAAPGLPGHASPLAARGDETQLKRGAGGRCDLRKRAYRVASIRAPLHARHSRLPGADARGQRCLAQPCPFAELRDLVRELEPDEVALIPGVEG